MALCQLRRDQLYLPDTTVSGRTAARFWRLVAQVRHGVPVQYLVHSAQFLDLDIDVDHRVFIPRPETEELVLRAASRVSNPKVIVDYGTGSGCIAIALARRFASARLLAIDTSAAALAVARRNIGRYRLASRIRLLRADRLDEPRLRRRQGQVDLIVANPPYVPTSRLSRLDRRVRNHEPRQALDGGPKGANIVTMLLEQGPALLRPGGLLALEIDHTHAGLVSRRAPGAVIERDLSGNIRYAFLTKRSC